MSPRALSVAGHAKIRNNMLGVAKKLQRNTAAVESSNRSAQCSHGARAWKRVGVKASMQVNFVVSRSLIMHMRVSEVAGTSQVKGFVQKAACQYGGWMRVCLQRDWLSNDQVRELWNVSSAPTCVFLHAAYANRVLPRGNGLGFSGRTCIGMVVNGRRLGFLEVSSRVICRGWSSTLRT